MNISARFPLVTGLLLAVLSALLSAGCGGKSSAKPPPRGPGYRYVVQLDGNSLPGQRFTVDVVPVNASNKELIQTMSVDDYFNNKANLRNGIQKLGTQVIATGETLVIDLEDKARKELAGYRFPGYSHIAVIADSTVRGSNPANDQRRILLPLDPSVWQRDWPGKKREIVVTFSSAGVQSAPGPISAP